MDFGVLQVDSPFFLVVGRRVDELLEVLNLPFMFLCKCAQLVELFFKEYVKLLIKIYLPDSFCLLLDIFGCFLRIGQLRHLFALP